MNTKQYFPLLKYTEKLIYRVMIVVSVHYSHDGAVMAFSLLYSFLFVKYTQKTETHNKPSQPLSFLHNAYRV